MIRDVETRIAKFYNFLSELCIVAMRSVIWIEMICYGGKTENRLKMAIDVRQLTKVLWNEWQQHRVN